jgi:hypothetical protein
MISNLGSLATLQEGLDEMEDFGSEINNYTLKKKIKKKRNRVGIKIV